MIGALLSDLWPYLAGAGAAVAALVAAWWRGKRGEAQKRDAAEYQARWEVVKRAGYADTGADLDDAARRKRLRDFAGKR